MTLDRLVDPGAAAPPSPPLTPLDPTGVPGLNEVLGGGIQRGSLVIIAGPPGGGKTILAHQIAFSAARAGRRTTVLTAFSEPTNKLIAHMRPYAFFDQELVGQTLDVLSVQQFLRQGMEAAAQEIVAAVRAARAELVVLDGFRGVRESAERPEEARRFIYDVSNRLSLLGITLILTSEANVRDATFFPEATSADVLLGLAFDAVGAHERRTLEVLKVRGAAPLSGRHALTIGDEGVAVFPRLEARVARLAGINRPLAAMPGTPSLANDGEVSGAGQHAPQLLPSGVAGLDPLLGGGLVAGTTTLVAGERGAGKTLLGLQFAAQGVRAAEPGVFVSFHETAAELLRKAEPFRWGGEIHAALAQGTLAVVRTPPVELRADVLAGDLLALLDRMRARRLVLDEVGEIERALSASGYPLRFHDFITALVEALRLSNVTTLLTFHAAAGGRMTLERELGPLAVVPQNLLWLRQGGREASARRTLTPLGTALSSQSSAEGDERYRVTIEAPDGLAVLGTAGGGRTGRPARSAGESTDSARTRDRDRGSNRDTLTTETRRPAVPHEEDSDDGD